MDRTVKVGVTRSRCRWVGLILLPIVLSCTDQQPPQLAGGGANAGKEDTPYATATSSAADSGVYGQMVAAWGNPPANPSTYECVKVLDANGQGVVAKGTCSGTWGQFRVPLPPGRFIMEAGGRWETVNGAVHFRANRREIEVKPGEWVKIAPLTPPGPMP